MTKPSDITSIETATHRTWNDWTSVLEKADAARLTHTEIAMLVRKILEGTVENPGWWAQSITVAYEQHIGRRAPGQRSDGSYETTVTKLLSGTKQDVYALWTEAYGDVKQFATQAVKNVRTSTTPVRLYWRADFEDGSRLAVAVEQKTPEKAMISVAHTKLGSKKDKDTWQRFWRESLDKL